jgi:DNA mismatch repair ATPase MutS
MRVRELRQDVSKSFADRKSVAKKAFSKFQAEINGYYDILRGVVNKLGVAGMDFIYSGILLTVVTDALLSLAQVATLPGYVRPKITEGGHLNIVQGK